jgi:hypothetical protein
MKHHPKLGLLAFAALASDLLFSDYRDQATALPKHPAVDSITALALPTGLGMLGNDQYGDCVWAGAAHETMVWNRMAGKTVAFTDASVLGDYAKCTGFNPKDPNSDGGTDMRVAANYRLKTGIADGSGHRHKVGAYLFIPGGSKGWDEAQEAVWLFGAVGIGIDFPDSAMDQFNAGKPWDVVHGAKVEGGHYVPIVSFDATSVTVITWGKLQVMTKAFFLKYASQAVTYLDPEMLAADGHSIHGFALADLKADLARLKPAV